MPATDQKVNNAAKSSGDSASAQKSANDVKATGATGHVSNLELAGGRAALDKSVALALGVILPIIFLLAVAGLIAFLVMRKRRLEEEAEAADGRPRKIKMKRRK